MDIFELDYWCKEHGCGFEVSSSDDGIRVTIYFVKDNQVHTAIGVCLNERTLKLFVEYVEKSCLVDQTKCDKQMERDKQMEHKAKNIIEFCAKCKFYKQPWDTFPCRECSHSNIFNYNDWFNEK